MPSQPEPAKNEATQYWLAKSVRTVLFLAVILTVAGIYAFFRTPIAVFPETNFPRVVIGVDNGVMPVEQMQVTITKPIEDAVNSVPGLATVRSTTSRGTAEVSLFFDWSVDMFRTLQLVDSALSKVQQSLPSTAKLTTNRLTFATFPILGYALTSNTQSQAQLWELAHLHAQATAQPRQRRQHRHHPGRAGARVPRRPQHGETPGCRQASPSSTSPTPSRPRTSSTRPASISRTINSSSPSSARRHMTSTRPQATHGEDHQRRGGTGAHRRRRRRHPCHHARLHRSHRQPPSPRFCINITRQPSSNTVAVADGVATVVAELQNQAAQRRHPQALLRPVAARPRKHQQRARRDPDRPRPRLHHPLSSSCATGAHPSSPVSSSRSPSPPPCSHSGSSARAST